MRESVPTARYSPVCNVLRQWKTSLILTYRVYRLYDMDLVIALGLPEFTRSDKSVQFNACTITIVGSAQELLCTCSSICSDRIHALFQTMDGARD